MDEVIQGHVLEVLASLEAESVSCVVTSPPYWSLRKYDAPDVVWGGKPGCGHEWGDIVMGGESYNSAVRWEHGDPEKAKSRADFPEAWQKQTPQGQFCARCGAWRGQFGLEPTPELYVEHTLEVLRAIRRVLRPDGVVWWNIGDGYSSGGSGQQSDAALHGEHLTCANSGSQAMPPYRGLPPKNLILMPFRVALAAQADGWWVRSVIIWSKPNAMPESTRDRPTTAHEYVLMLTKSARYWYDQEAVREKWADATLNDARFGTEQSRERNRGGRTDGYTTPSGAAGNPSAAGRNLRSVWEFPTAQTPEAHFATFPEELPRRCIEASCPREICAKCGTARVRVVESTPMVTRPGPRAGQYGQRTSDGLTGTMLEPPSSTTTGWTSCDCAEPDYRPGIVLDPFCGIGTTGVVAKRLGRRFIGIELSEKYAGMARDKLRLFWRKTNLAEPAAPEGQAVLPMEAP